MTADVDVTIELRNLAARALLQELSAVGFSLRIDLGDEFLRDARLWPLVHEPTAMPVDVVIAASNVHKEFLDRRRLVDMGGRRVPMISPEDLVVTKVLAARRKDFDDLRGVLTTQTNIDIDRIRRLLAELDAALGGDALSRRFERLIRAVERDSSLHTRRSRPT